MMSVVSPATAVITTTTPGGTTENGKIKKLLTTDPGSGYSSTPTATVAGFEKVEFRVSVHFDQDLKKNGSIDTLKVAKP